MTSALSAAAILLLRLWHEPQTRTAKKVAARSQPIALRLKHVGWIGGSIDVLVEERGDIYIDAADSTATNAWLDPVKAQGWVLMQLKAQGS